jgi:subtilisin family serine protease
MIGQVEAGGNNLKAATHPCLDNITQSGTTNALHATQVAGVLVCSDATRTGLAPDAQLFIRSGSLDSDIQNATTAAREWGANAINLSLGSPATDDTPNSFDKFLDDIVWTHWRTVVKSAGNTGNHLTHPGLGYNTFTVGGANDGNTVSRIGDTMYSSSAYINPKSSNSDRQKPEVVAFAVNINMPNNSSGFSDNSGTSFAAPQVTGTAALMMEAASNLQGWPEIIKATIMATARFNIEGDARLSDYDGAGAIDTRGAVDVVRNGGPSNSNYLGDGVSCGSSWPREYTMSLTAGKATRAVIVWDQDPNYANYVSQPAVDLDLEIVQPNGSWLVRSNSYDNTYEIASFTPPVTGTYIARVVNWRCDASPLGIGFAWYQDP